MEQLGVGGAQDPCVYFQLFAVYLEIPGRRNYKHWQTQIWRELREISSILHKDGFSIKNLLILGSGKKWSWRSLQILTKKENFIFGAALCYKKSFISHSEVWPDLAKITWQKFPTVVIN